MMNELYNAPQIIMIPGQVEPLSERAALVEENQVKSLQVAWLSNQQLEIRYGTNVVSQNGFFCEEGCLHKQRMYIR